MEASRPRLEEGPSHARQGRGTHGGGRWRWALGNSTIESRAALATVSREAGSVRPPTPPTQCPTSGRAPDTGQMESGWDGRLMRGCPEREGSGTEMKDRCPNCNRQPVSNALAASISEPASHDSRLAEAWADGWLPEPWGGSPLADCTWDKWRSWGNRTTGNTDLVLNERPG